jgi:hypothetical protein
MALTLVSEAGSASANSFCSLASCLPLLEENIHIYATFASLSTANAESCLIYATSLLDAEMSWIGYKATTTQSLRWPRKDAISPDNENIDNTTIPLAIQRGTSYFAYFLSQDNRAASESDTYGFKQLEAGSLNMVIDKYDRKPVMPSIVWDLLRPYGNKIQSATRVLERR